MQPLENAGKYATGGARIVLTWHSIGREKQRVFSDWWNFCFFYTTVVLTKIIGKLLYVRHTRQ